MPAEVRCALPSTQVASAPQPEAAASTDMRLFRLRPLADETPEVIASREREREMD